MKITENKIRQIIREEARQVLRESSFPERPHRSGRGSSEDNLRDFLLNLMRDVGFYGEGRGEPQIIIDMILDLCYDWAEEDPETVFKPDSDSVWQNLQDEYDDYGMLDLISKNRSKFDRLVNALIKDTCDQADLDRGRMIDFGNTVNSFVKGTRSKR